MPCPKCGFDAGPLPECPRCGIVFAKYRPEGTARRRAAPSTDGGDPNHRPPGTPGVATGVGVAAPAATVAAPHTGGSAGRWRFLGLGRRTQLFQQLATLERAGVPLPEALRSIREHEPSASARGALTEMRDALLEGGTLRDAAAPHRFLFDRAALALLAAAERSGRLAEAWDVLSRGAELRLALRRELVSALFYPVIILVLGCFLLPLRVLILEGTGPYLRAALLPLGIFGGTVFGLFGANYLVRRWTGRSLSLAARLPLFGPVFRRLALARAAGTLGRLLDAGLPAPASLREAGRVAGHARVEAAFHAAAAAIEAGATLVEGFRESTGLSPVFLQVLASAERGGSLPESLNAFSHGELGAAIHRLKLLTRAVAIAFTLGVFAVLAWRSFAQLTEVRDSIEKALDKVIDGDTVQRALDQFHELERQLR